MCALSLSTPILTPSTLFERRLGVQAAAAKGMAANFDAEMGWVLPGFSARLAYRGPLPPRAVESGEPLGFTAAVSCPQLRSLNHKPEH